MIKEEYELEKARLLNAKERLSKAKTDTEIESAMWSVRKHRKCIINLFPDYESQLKDIMSIENTNFDFKLNFEQTVFDAIDSDYSEEYIRDYVGWLSNLMVDYMLLNRDLVISNNYELTTSMVKEKAKEDRDAFLGEFIGLIK